MSALFSRRWWWTTLLVLAAMGVMVRLGFWQLERLAQRRARNAETARQLEAAPLLLTGEERGESLAAYKYRTAIVRGEYDHTNEIVLKNQSWAGHPGVHLITPLAIENTDWAVLVDRGWIPYEESASENWDKFVEPGPVEVAGLIRLSETPPVNVASTGQTAPAEPQTEWFRVDIAAIQAQMPYELLPIYVQQAPTSKANAELPYRSEPEFDLSDGPHLGYAIQWYAFALMLGIGYARYVSQSGAGA